MDLIDLKNKYIECMNNKTSSSDQIFCLEQKLYSIIQTNYSQFFNFKINMARRLKRNSKLWNIAYKHKYMRSSELEKYDKQEQDYFIKFNNNNIFEYYSLWIFDKCNFIKDEILKLQEPDKFAFALFRCEYPNNEYPFVTIIDDLLNYKQKNKNFASINEIISKYNLSKAEGEILQMIYENPNDTEKKLCLKRNNKNIKGHLINISGKLGVTYLKGIREFLYLHL